MKNQLDEKYLVYIYTRCCYPIPVKFVLVRIIFMENAYAKSLDVQILFWSQYNLSDKVRNMKEGLETISKSQESSVKSRKLLASKTKELRSVPSGERLTVMKSLLKSYQEEIDQLTLRSQFAENLVSSCYSDMSSLVDPSQLFGESKMIYTQYVEAITETERLDAANSEMRQQLTQLQSLSKQRASSESENSSLRNEIAQLKSLNSSLEEELKEKDGDVKKLGESLKSLSSVHEENVRLQLQIATLNKEINEYYSVTNNVGPDSDRSMAAQQLSHLRSQVESLQEELAREKEANRVARELLKQSEESFDQKEEGYESQIMMLNTEIERQATSIESLRSELQNSTSIASTPVMKSEQVSNLVGDLRKTIQTLKEENEAASLQFEKEKEAITQDHEREIAHLQEQIDELNEDLRTRVTADEMKRIQSILVTLQSIGIPVEFSSTTDLPIPDAQAVLLEKIQHLETSNSSLRSTFNDIYNKYMQSENDRHTLEEKDRDNTEAMKQMESQISELEQRVIGENGSATVAGFSSNVEVILKDQRDRYKRRVDELEAELNRDKASLESLYAVINQLKSQLSSERGSSSNYDRYGSSKYHSSELSSNPLERVSFKVAQSMVRSSRTRLFVSCYFILVHLLVLLLFIRQSTKC